MKNTKKERGFSVELHNYIFRNNFKDEGWGWDEHKWYLILFVYIRMRSSLITTW